MSLVVAVEVVRHQVVVTVITDSSDQGAKVMDRAKSALLDLGKHFLQVGVNFMRAVLVTVSEIFNVFSEVAKQEDVVLANLASYFNLFMVSRGIKCRFHLLTLAPSQVPMMRPPFSTNFMLLVPDALRHMLGKVLIPWCLY
jgi:hypothetical protein